MAVEVTTTITYEFHELTRWGYELRVDIPTVATADSAFWAIAPELRSDRVLFGVSLNFKKLIAVAADHLFNPRQSRNPNPSV